MNVTPQDLTLRILIAASLALLPACGLVRSLAFSMAPPFAEPAEGPRAKLRIVYQGAAARFYPGDTCFNSENPDAALAGPYAGFVRSAKRLDMPLPPTRGKYDEFYVKANESIAISFSIEQKITTNTGGVITGDTCGPVGFMFTPSENGMYEARFEWVTKDRCGFAFEAIEKDAAGAFQRRALPVPATTFCPKKPAPEGSVTIPSGTADRDRWYP